MATYDYSRYGSYYQGGTHGNRHHHRRRSTTRRALIIGGTVVVGVAAVGIATPALASNTIDDITSRASSIADLYQGIASSLSDLDFARMQELTLQAATEVSDFREQLNNPLWNIAEVIPVYGSDVKAAKSLIAMLDNLTTQALVPVANVLGPVSADSLVSSGDGTFWINTSILQEITDVLLAAFPTIKSSIQTLEGIGELHIGQLNDAVSQAKELLAPFSGDLDKFENLLRILPQLLGADGQQRLYLVAAQNNVELRSTGGFPGAWCPIYVNNGSITMGDVGSVYDYMPVDESVSVWMSDEELTLFGGSATYMPGNVNCNPDFVRDCQMWSEFWTIFQGSTVNGIIAMDPIFLQSVVGLTPGTTLEDGTWIDGSNTARSLMHDTYWNYMGDGDAMDAHFAVAAGAATDAVMSSLDSIDLKSLIEVIDNGINNGNLLVWLSDADEEAALSAFDDITGEILYDTTAPVLGVYLSNASWSKIDWWLNMDVTTSDPVENADGSSSYTVTLDFSNVATWDEINAADNYIVGTNDVKWGRDDILNSLYLYAPAGGTIADVQTDEHYTWTEATYNGLQVLFGYLHVAIDSPAHIVLTVTTSPDASEPLKIRKTPTCQNVR